MNGVHVHRKRSYKMRAAFAVLCVLCSVGFFVHRLIDIQVVNAQELIADAEELRTVPKAIPGIRGDIIDSQGVVLATTQIRYDVQLSPKRAKAFFRLRADADARPKSDSHELISVAQACQELGALVGKPGEEIERTIAEALAENPESDFAYVKRSVDLDTVNAIDRLGIDWVSHEENPARVYPNGAVAGNLIGFVGADQLAMAGVEYSQDACLSEQDGAHQYEKGGDGVILPGTDKQTRQKRDGGVVQLTIDTDLQWQAQQIVERQVAKTGARWGMAVVTEVATGKLRAVAESKTVDPNNVDASDPIDLNSKAFQWPFEPGSTYKTVTAAALIDQGVANPLTQVVAPGSYEAPNGARFADSWVHGPIPYTLTGVMVDSSNVGISLLGANLSPETRFAYLKRFGIGEPTNAGLGVESAGLLRDWQDWDYQTVYNTMFGQGLSATAVQTSGIYQAIANKGVRIPVNLVEGCTSSDGTFTPHVAGEPVQALSPEAAAETSKILEMLPQDSWLTERISIPGYRLAGKTGTAEQVDETGRYSTSSYVNTFAGFFPADDPKYVVVFVLGHPDVQQGAPEAVIGFRDVAQATIKTFAVPPSSTPAETLPKRF